MSSQKQDKAEKRGIKNRMHPLASPHIGVVGDESLHPVGIGKAMLGVMGSSAMAKMDIMFLLPNVPAGEGGSKSYENDKIAQWKLTHGHTTRSPSPGRSLRNEARFCKRFAAQKRNLSKMLRGILDLALHENVVVLFTAAGCADQGHVHERQLFPEPNFCHSCF